MSQQTTTSVFYKEDNKYYYSNVSPKFIKGVVITKGLDEKEQDKYTGF